MKNRVLGALIMVLGIYSQNGYCVFSESGNIAQQAKDLSSLLDGYKNTLFGGKDNNKNLLLLDISFSSKDNFNKFLNKLEDFVGAKPGRIARDHEKQRAQDILFLTARYRELVSTLRLVFAKLSSGQAQKKSLILSQSRFNENDKNIIGNMLVRLGDSIDKASYELDAIIKRSTDNQKTSGVCLTAGCRLRYQLVEKAAEILLAVYDQIKKNIVVIQEDPVFNSK